MHSIDEAAAMVLMWLRTGETHRAVMLAQALLEETPDDGRIWELLGLAHAQLSAWRTSVEAFERAMILVPLSASSEHALAEGYTALGKLDLARGLYRHLAEQKCLPTELLLSVAAGLDHVGEPCLAVEVCREAIRRDPDQAQPYYELGFYLGRSGHPVALVESLARRAMQLAPDHARYRVGLASYVYRQGRVDEAYDLLRAMPDDKLAEIDCACCLRRLIEIFARIGDDRRQQVCQRLVDAMPYDHSREQSR